MGKDLLLTTRLLLLPKGYIHRNFVDYDEMFVPIIPFDVLPLIVRKFSSVGWLVYHADSTSAFLNGEVDGQLYQGQEVLQTGDKSVWFDPVPVPLA